MITDRRKERIAEVINNRTYSVVPVLENIYDRGNVSAVIRSAEAFGFQSVHIVESERFKVANRVTQGADKWLDLHRWKSTAECVRSLKKQGFRILATHLEGAQPITEFDFTVPTAVVFGNEKEGVSQELLNQADGRVMIPMLGFVQSFNISVAAALCFYHIYLDRVKRQGVHGDLSEEVKQQLMVNFYQRSIPSSKNLMEKNHGGR